MMKSNEEKQHENVGTISNFIQTKSLLLENISNNSLTNSSSC